MNGRSRQLALFVVALIAVDPVWATCGGGGGGGRGGAGQGYKTDWKKSTFEDLLQSAKYKKEGLLLYFQAKDTKEHRFFKTKWPNDASKERAFYRVKSDGDEAKKLRAAYAVDSKKHEVFIVDWFGNPFRHDTRKGRAKFKAQALKGTLFKMSKLVTRLEKKLASKLGSAAKAEERGSYKIAIKALVGILRYQGYDVVKKSQEVMARIEAAGNKEVDAALKLDEPDRTKQIKALKKNYDQTAVATRCAEILDPKKKAPREKKDSIRLQPAARETWADLFGHIDYVSLSPSTSERVNGALHAGLAFEERGLYEQARRAYALAAGLDVNDPIPLVYLGELYRHHTGEWDEAEKVMRRVLELDNNDFAVAIALHGIGKMTIWRGDNEKGLELFAKSIARHPSALCYRNLAVYWNTEGDAKKAFDYATKAYELDPKDAYNQVFYSVYLLKNGRQDDAAKLMEGAEFDPSMSYNYACYHAIKGERDLVVRHLKRHFFEYEQYDAVRAFEMAEARMDAFFAPWLDDPEFKEITALAGRTPWLTR